MPGSAFGSSIQRVRRRLALCFSLLALAARASSTSGETLDAVVSRSDRILLARVTAVRVSEAGPLVSTLELAVERTLKGGVERTLQLRVLGGERGGLSAEVAGAPTLRAGQRALFFLRCEPRAPTSCTLASLEAGALVVVDGQVRAPALREPVPRTLEAWLRAAGARPPLQGSRERSAGAPRPLVPRGSPR